MRNLVNIVDGNRKFPYLIESIENREYLVPNDFEILDLDEIRAETGSEEVVIARKIYMGRRLRSVVRCVNDWKKGLFSPDPNTPIGWEPEMTTRRILTVIVPDSNPSVYTKNARYAVDVTTKIGDTKIVLASHIFSDTDLLSIDKPFCEGGFMYHQYISIPILDPWDLSYSKEYKSFRETYCYGNYSGQSTPPCGSVLDVEISVVDEYGDNEWIPSTRYTSGRNLILLSEMDSDQMSLHLSEFPEDGKMNFLAKLKYNVSYDEDILNYIRENYLIEVESIVPELVVMDSEKVYKIVDLDPVTTSEVMFDSSGVRFSGWDEYTEGMYLTCTFRMFDNNGLELMDIRSNNIPLSPRLFSVLSGEEIIVTEDMEIINLDVVNKINKNIVQVGRPDEYKSNIIRPVFYRAYPTDDIELHSTVNFNIGLDLDQYKSKVDTFALQIGSAIFQETGRVPGYVVFRISGERLQKDSETGTYYILDKDGTMVTSGKYKFVD